MKVCMLGNSHAACVNAVQKYEECLEGVEFRIFTSPGQRGPFLRLLPDGTFKASPKNLRTTVGEFLNVDDFDVLYICAMSFGAPLGKQILEKRHILGDCQVEDWPNPGGISAMSRTDFRQILYERLVNTGVPGFLRKLSRRGYAGRLIAQLPPPPSERFLHNKDWILRQRWGTDTRSAFEDYLDIAYGVVRDLLTAHGMPITLLPCPPDAINRSLMRAAYSHKDWVHGNREYGRLTLRALASELGVKTKLIPQVEAA